MNIFKAFVNSVCADDPALYEAVTSLYHIIMESGDVTSSAVADALRNKVKPNPYEAHGDDVYGKAADAGLDDPDGRTDQTLDSAIDQAVANSQFDNLGSAMSTESGLPSEDDLGASLGDSPDSGNGPAPGTPDDDFTLDDDAAAENDDMVDDDTPSDASGGDDTSPEPPPDDGGLDL